MNPRNRRARLDDIRRVAFEMRDNPIVAPDLTSSILDRVDAERPFLAPSVRRKLPWIRIGVGACVVLAALSVALTYRWAPKTVQALAQQPAPISDVVQCVQSCTAHKFAPKSAPMLSVREADAMQFLAAMATAANISESEGRPSTPVSQPVIAEATPLALPSQAVSIRTPAPVYMRASDTSYSFGFASGVFPPESVMTDATVRTAVFSSDVPRVKVVPNFLEHDLDGLFLPR
jgi:hypothetical protein